LPPTKPDGTYRRIDRPSQRSKTAAELTVDRERHQHEAVDRQFPGDYRARHQD